MTIAEILRLSVEDRKSAYKAEGIGTVEIDGNKFTDYKAFSFLWEKSYVKSPERSGDGSIANLNSYATFVTPHLKIDFSMMSIDSYRTLMTLLYSKNEFTVTCYDIVNNKPTTNKMYFSTEEMPKLWTIARALNGEEWTELLGVQDYTVEMIGTNVSIDILEIRYHDDDGNLIPEATQYVDKGVDTIIDYAYVAPTGKRFDNKWSTERYGKGTIYLNGHAIMLQDNLDLYPVTTNTTQYTLSFSYGNGVTPTAQNTEPINSITIYSGETINTAIGYAKITMPDGSTFAFPENGTGSQVVNYEGKNYTPYVFKGWYWTDRASGTKVTGSTKFNNTLNRTIYQIYEPAEYYLAFQTNEPSIYFNNENKKYGEKINLPYIQLNNKRIVGWYLDANFTKAFDGIMPPKGIMIYAKWG